MEELKNTKRQKMQIPKTKILSFYAYFYHSFVKIASSYIVGKSNEMITLMHVYLIFLHIPKNFFPIFINIIEISTHKEVHSYQINGGEIKNTVTL